MYICHFAPFSDVAFHYGKYILGRVFVPHFVFFIAKDRCHKSFDRVGVNLTCCFALTSCFTSAYSHFIVWTITGLVE